MSFEKRLVLSSLLFVTLGFVAIRTKGGVLRSGNFDVTYCAIERCFKGDYIPVRKPILTVRSICVCNTFDCEGNI